MPALPFADAVASELWELFIPARTPDLIILNKDFEIVTMDGLHDLIETKADDPKGTLQTWLEKSSQL